MGAKRGASLWDRLLGPVLFYDLVRLTRRGSSTIFVGRALYVGLLLLAIVIFCGVELGLNTPVHFLEAFRAGFPVSANKAGTFASHFFFVLLGMQLAIVVLLTPAYVAGAIAEDRQRRIVDFLLVSDLSNREIVWGKLLSRLAHLALLLLTGLPLLGVAQVMGGVHPVFLLTGLVVALMTMASLGALSILESICNRRPQRAILHVYVGVGWYLLLSTAFTLVGFITSGWPASSLPERGIMICCSGNPLMPMARLVRTMGSAGWPTGVLVSALDDCAILHGLFFFGCLGLAIHRLRYILARSPMSREERLARRLQMCRRGLDQETARQLAALASPPGSSAPFRPSLTNQPILWKELHVESPPFRISRQLSRIFDGVVRLLTILLASLFPLLLLMKFIWGIPKEELRFAVLALSVLLTALLLVGVAARAAGCLSGERERNTLDALLATTLENAALINGKWLASLCKMRGYAIMLAVVWVTSTLLGILAWQSLPFLVLAAVSWACCAASLGVCCSLLCRDTWRATAVSLALLLAMSAFPCFVDWKELSPIGIVRALLEPACWENRLSSAARFSQVVRFSFGVVVSCFLAALMWTGTHFFFPRVTGRMPCECKGRSQARVLIDRR